MVFKYSVVRYVPSVVRDEAINLGVLLETDNPPGLYLRFLGAMSRVRRRHPDANLLALRHLSEHFQKLEHEADPDQPVFDFAKSPGVTLDILHKGSVDTTFQVTAPRATVGDDPIAELDEVFELFVAETPVVESKDSAALAPSRFRRLVAKRLRQSGLVDDNRLQPLFLAAGTVQPWIFDFGQRNGSLTLVQSLVLQTIPDEAMNRALLLQARVEDVAEAEQMVPRTIAVTDEQIPDSPAWRYLDHHKVKIVSVNNSDAIKALMEPELHLR
jgi:hypothetical protein